MEQKILSKLISRLKVVKSLSARELGGQKMQHKWFPLFYVVCERVNFYKGWTYFFVVLRITRPVAVVLLLLLLLLLLLFSESIVRLTVLLLLLPLFLPLRLSKRSLNLLLLLLNPDLPDAAGRRHHRRCHHHCETSSPSAAGTAAAAAYSQECLTLPFSWRGLRGLPIVDPPGLPPPIAYSVAWLATCWMPFSMQDW